MFWKAVGCRGKGDGVSLMYSGKEPRCRRVELQGSLKSQSAKSSQLLPPRKRKPPAQPRPPDDLLPVSEVACWLPPEGPVFPAVGTFLAAILLQKVSVLGYSLLSYIAASPGTGQMQALS